MFECVIKLSMSAGLATYSDPAVLTETMTEPLHDIGPIESVFFQSGFRHFAFVKIYSKKKVINRSFFLCIDCLFVVLEQTGVERLIVSEGT